MATYKEIILDVEKYTGITIHHPCWIAHAKELNGLKVRPAHNRKSIDKREVPCPHYMKPILKTSFIRLGMI